MTLATPIPNEPLPPVDEFEQNRTALADIDARYHATAEYLQTHRGQLDQIKGATMDLQKLRSIRSKYASARDRDPKNLGQQAAKLAPRLEEQMREIYATTIADLFRKNELSIEVKITGDGKRHLLLSSPQMIQPLVDRLQNDMKIREQAKFFGFNKLTYTKSVAGSRGESRTEDL